MKIKKIKELLLQDTGNYYYLLERQSTSKYHIKSSISDFNAKYFIDELVYNYSEYSYYERKLPNMFITDHDDADKFLDVFNHFTDTNNDSIVRIWNALNEEYNILDNYNGIIETVTGTSTITDVFGENNGSVTYGQVKTTMGSATDNTINQVANSETTTQTSFLNDSKSINEIGQRINTVDSYSNDTQMEEHTDTHTNSGNTVTETKHGNLGLTTSQSMVENEVLLRQKMNFYRFLTDWFIKEYCFIFDFEE